MYLNQESPALYQIAARINLHYALIFSRLFCFIVYFWAVQSPGDHFLSPFPLQLIFSVLFAGLILSVLLYFLPKYVIGRQILVYHLIISILLLTFWRSVFYHIGERWIKNKTIGIAAGIESMRNCC